jgi:hypothetical protein
MRTLSPAMRHQARMLAQMAAGKTEHGDATTGSQYELMLCQLAADRRTLSQVQSIKTRIELKKGLLPKYQPWVEGVLAAGKGAQDDVLTTILVWRIDAGDYEGALHIARYAVKFNMSLPDQYQRNLATTLLDEFADAYLLKKGLETNPQLATDLLDEINALTKEHDVPDQARAKLYKALAYAQLDAWNISGSSDRSPLSGVELAAATAAHSNLVEALKLFTGIGVKKDIERLERRLKKSAQESSSPNEHPPAHGGAESTGEQIQSAPTGTVPPTADC